MKIKVCGMREVENVNSLIELPVDYIGFIFYDKSKRSVLSTSIPNTNRVNRVGVFVNETTKSILATAEKWNLSHIQLHGEELPAQCDEIKRAGLTVMKAIPIDDDFDFASLQGYYDKVDYFVFDTKGKARGGNGITFNWQKLSEYKGSIPFFLSGGIHMDSVDAIKKLVHPQLFALDINSRFETKPGLKNIESIKSFIYELQH